MIGTYPTGSVSDDARAISRSLAGEPDAFTTVFAQHYPAVARFLRARVGIEHGDELAAETFEVAWKKRETYDPTRSEVRAWLFGIAVNVLRHHRRSEARRWRAYGRVGVEPMVDLTDRSDDRLDALALRPRVGAALAALGAEERDLVLLSAWADLSYEELSAACGIPVGTVRSRLSRARARLRTHLDLENHDA